MASNLWLTPIPYLFICLGIMMMFIAAALVVLACSHRKSSNRRDPAESSKENTVIVPLDMEPRFVVIMPGDSKPSCIAKPLSSVVDVHVVSVDQLPCTAASYLSKSECILSQRV